MTGIFMATSIISINALFERKSFKYISINAGYWIICMGLMAVFYQLGCKLLLLYYKAI
jgi:hypothetical protein